MLRQTPIEWNCSDILIAWSPTSNGDFSYQHIEENLILQLNWLEVYFGSQLISFVCLKAVEMLSRGSVAQW